MCKYIKGLNINAKCRPSRTLIVISSKVLLGLIRFYKCIQTWQASDFIDIHILFKILRGIWGQFDKTQNSKQRYW